VAHPWWGLAPSTPGAAGGSGREPPNHTMQQMSALVVVVPGARSHRVHSSTGGGTGYVLHCHQSSGKCHQSTVPKGGASEERPTTFDGGGDNSAVKSAKKIIFLDSWIP